MDKQTNIKRVIDEKQPSLELKLALLSILAMPKKTEMRIVKGVLETMAQKNVTDRDQIRLAVTMGLLMMTLKMLSDADSEDETHVHH